MQRGLARRIGAAFVALWFGVVIVEPAVLHSCPAHGAHQQSGQSVAQAHAGHHGASEESAPEENAGCTCVGPCAMHGAAALAQPDAVLLDVATVTLAVAAPAAREHVPAVAAHALPFSNGPPRA